jgi:hypothetical protein
MTGTLGQVSPYACHTDLGWTEVPLMLPARLAMMSKAGEILVIRRPS